MHLVNDSKEKICTISVMNNALFDQSVTGFYYYYYGQDEITRSIGAALIA